MNPLYRFLYFSSGDLLVLNLFYYTRFRTIMPLDPYSPPSFSYSSTHAFYDIPIYHLRCKPHEIEISDYDGRDRRTNF